MPNELISFGIFLIEFFVELNRLENIFLSEKSIYTEGSSFLNLESGIWNFLSQFIIPILFQIRHQAAFLQNIHHHLGHFCGGVCLSRRYIFNDTIQ
jgi:hypothetical protein